MKNKKNGRPFKYPMQRITSGKTVRIKSDNLESCRQSVHYYAKKHNLSIKTKLKESYVEVECF